MDITDDGSHPMGSPPPEGEARPLQTREEAYPLEPIATIDLPELLSRLSCELAQSLTYASEAREAKIRELQDAMKNGTYHVTDAQIADKMLRHTLLEDLP